MLKQLRNVKALFVWRVVLLMGCGVEGGTQCCHEALVLDLGDIDFASLVALGIALLIGLAHHLVRLNVAQLNVILGNERQQILDGTINLVGGEGSLEGVALKFDANCEVVAALFAIHHAAAGMIGDLARLAHDVARAVGVDNDMGTHVAGRVHQHIERSLNGGLGSVVQYHALHGVDALGIDIGCGIAHLGIGVEACHSVGLLHLL